MRRWLRWTLPPALILSCLLGSASAAPRVPTRAAVQEAMDDVWRRELGLSSGTILTVDGAQELAKDLKDTAELIEAYEADLEKKTRKEQDAMKLDGRRVPGIKTRAAAWNDHSTYPLLESSANQANARWITSSSIRGNRILVKRSQTATWYWRILVERAKRSDKIMTDWIKSEAARYLKEHKARAEAEKQWARDFPGASLAEAEEGGVPEHHVHHKAPLFAGIANGGKDLFSNYVLLTDDKHKLEHKSGDTWKRFGTYRLYVVRGGEFEELPEDELD